jgi:DNA polymerase-3 subunit gamma/tau
MYRVLARKYRPQTFADLIGQEVLVRTLTNAFNSGRIAHAFLLTGIRGIGKTTTARIIARGLNCIGPDGNGEATTTPCGACPNCAMIAEDRHPDVIEMDAASRTGVDDVREIIDSVQYAPTSARYKVYIIDEVHMLSKNAFNALLKTLEEPPPHVKFIFATTEIRKIPVTIISRCQRFDLKRVELDQLAQHLVNVAAREQVELAQDCATLIATAAEGSVRDALSLLDQAIALHTDASGNVAITPESVRDMLGLADKTQTFTLLQHIFAGRMEEALTHVRRLHTQGADPAMLLGDLIDITHYLTRICVAPALAANVHFAPAEQALAAGMASSLTVPALTRAWQILLKGHEEMRHAAQALATLEMILVRLGYASSLPTPAEIARALENGATSLPAPSPARSGGGGSVHSMTSAVGSGSTMPVTHAPTTIMSAAAPKIESQPLAAVESYEDVVKLFEEKREAMLASHLIADMRLISFEQGRIEVRPVAHIAADVPARIHRRLQEWTGQRWTLAYSEAEGEPTIRERRQAEAAKARDYAVSHPKVQAALDAFPGATVVDFIPQKK